MAKAKRRLGLNDMFPMSDTVAETALSSAFPAVDEAVKSIVEDIGRTYGNIPVDRIVPNPYQPRKNSIYNGSRSWQTPCKKMECSNPFSYALPPLRRVSMK